MVGDDGRDAVALLVPRLLDIDVDCAELATSEALSRVCELIAERLLTRRDDAVWQHAIEPQLAAVLEASAAHTELAGSPASLEAGAAELRAIAHAMSDGHGAQLPHTVELVDQLADRLREHAQLMRDEMRRLREIEAGRGNGRIMRSRSAARIQRAEGALQRWALDIVRP